MNENFNQFQQIQIEDNIIQTKNHILIWEEVPDRFEPVQFQEPLIKEEQEEMSNIYERISGGTKYKLYLGNFESDYNENFRLYDKLLSASSNDYLEIHVASDGGSFYEIVEFYNIIKPKFDYCTSYLHRGYSAGSIAFLLGNERVVYEHSDMMVHSYSTGIIGKRDDMLTQVEHTDKVITRFFKKIYNPFFTKKELNKINKGKDFWLDSESMLKRGIATGIITDAGEYFDRETFLKNLKKK